MQPTVSPLTVVEIPLSQIRPNPHNPGPPIPEDLIEDLAANVEAVGLQNPIKVMPDPSGASSGSPAPGEGKWVILSGERRYRAFQRLKRESIPAIVLNPNPEEAVIITHTDNDVRDRGWWADYQTIEQLKQANSNLNQGQIAIKLKLDRPKVNRAFQLLPLLSPGARVLVCSNATPQNKGNWAISERAAAQLADLGDPQAVEQALSRVIDDQMTEAQVRQMVAAMKGGTPAESYVPAPPKPKTAKSQSTSPSSQPSPLKGEGASANGNGNPALREPQGPEPSRGVGETAYSGTEVASSPTAAYSASAPRNDSRNYDMVQGARNDSKLPHGGVFSGIVGGILWTEVKSAAHRLFHRFVPAGGQLQVGQPSAETGAVSARISRWLSLLFSKYQKLGLKDRVWVGFLTAGLILLSANYLMHQATGFLTRLLFRPAQTQTGSFLPVVPAGQPVQEPGRVVASQPKPSDAVSQPPVSNPAPLIPPKDQEPAPAQAAEKPEAPVPSNAPSQPKAGPGGSQPSSAPAAAKPQGDVVQQIGDVAKDVSSGVSAVDHTASAVDGARKLLGF